MHMTHLKLNHLHQTVNNSTNIMPMFVNSVDIPETVDGEETDASGDESVEEEGQQVNEEGMIYILCISS